MKEQTPTKNNSKLAWIIAGVLFVLSAWLLYERMQLASENKSLKAELEETNNQKSDVKNELAELLVEYEGMKTDNDTLNAKLQAEQAKIQELLDEVQKVKKTSAAQIARYKREIKTLREVMRSFVVQIDSLNTQNKELTAQVKATQSKYKNVVKEKSQIEAKRDSLSSQVEIASTLIADNITTEALNKRNNNTSRARKAYKIKVCFTIRDNPVAETGSKDIYLRIADPSGQVLTGSEYSLFQAEGKELAASSMRAVEYDGNKTSTCVYFVSSSEFSKGNYAVDIYEGGSKIGSTTFKLK